MNDPFSIIYLAFLILVVVLSLLMTFKLDRDRIRENIESHGGKVVEILRRRGFRDRYNRAYEVSYITASGQRVKASCKTTMWSGVYWVNDHPPGLGEADVLSMNHAIEEPAPAEPIHCSGCGAMIPANKESCPQCGWSYRATHAGQ